MDQNINITGKKVLSDRKYLLEEVRFTVNNGAEQKKEIYVRGNSASVLLYDTVRSTVILVRQLRMPTYLNGNEDGMLLECCAGMIDEGESAAMCIRREAVEETGYALQEMEQIAEAYLSPASVTELTTLFIAPYTLAMKTSEGGGLKEEQEDITVLEMPFDQAFGLIATGGIRDAKTILLLLHLKLKGVMS